MKKRFNLGKVFFLLLTGIIVLLTGFYPVTGMEAEARPGSRQVNAELADDRQPGEEPVSGRVAVLTFHAVSEKTEISPVIISSGELEKTFKMMLDSGYTLITLDQFHDFIDGTSGVPDKSVLITFDDGYEDNYTLAYPVAKKYSVPAVIFPVTKWFSDYPRPEPHRPHLTLEQAISLEEEGLWDFGSHSHDGHRKIPGETGSGPFFSTLVVQPGYRESDGEFKARIWADVSLSMYTLEKMGIEQVDFAFPYGSYNDMAKQVLTAAGYKYLYTNEPGINETGQDPNHIYRISSAYTAEGNLALLNYYFSLK